MCTAVGLVAWCPQRGGLPASHSGTPMPRRVPGHPARRSPSYARPAYACSCQDEENRLELIVARARIIAALGCRLGPVIGQPPIRRPCHHALKRLMSPDWR